MRIDYRRVALVNPRLEERLTIDFALTAAQRDTRVELGARERSMSKYCAAMALLHPGMRHNRLRPALRVLQGLR